MTIQRKFVISFLCLLFCCVSAQSQPDEQSRSWNSKLLEQGSETNPFIDPTGYRAYIERSEKAFRDQVTRESK